MLRLTTFHLLHLPLYIFLHGVNIIQLSFYKYLLLHKSIMLKDWGTKIKHGSISHCA